MWVAERHKDEMKGPNISGVWQKLTELKTKETRQENQQEIDEKGSFIIWSDTLQLYEGKNQYNTIDFFDIYWSDELINT